MFERTRVSALGALALVVTAGTLGAGCNGRAHAETVESGAGVPRRTLQTSPATARPFAEGRTYVGTVVADRDVVLSAPSGGRLDAMNVDLGDHVERGSVLARLRDEDASLATAAAAAQVTQASARLGGASSPASVPEVVAARAQLDAATDARKRVEALAEKGSASAQDIVRARAQETTARAQLDAASAAASSAFAEVSRASAQVRRESATLRETTLRAPFGGVIAERFARASEVVPPGGPVVRLVDPAGVRVEIEVPQHEADAAVVGAVASIEDEGASPEVAHVVRVAPAVSATRGRRVALALDAASPSPDGGAAKRVLVPGARVRVRIELGAPRELAFVPRTAVRSLAGTARAFVVNDGRVSERLLDVARTGPDGILVAEAIKPGELVVLEPPQGLRDGDEVAR